jgi:DNA segregation ATPase FtsK/SpoIIIE-like protein
VGSVASAEDAKVAAGLPKTGAERLLGHGDFLVIARGEQLRVQGAYASKAEMKRIVSRLCGAQARGAREERGASSRQGVIERTKRWVNRLPALAGHSSVAR